MLQKLQPWPLNISETAKYLTLANIAAQNRINGGKRSLFLYIKTKCATYNLCLGASEVQEHHAHAVVRGHAKAFEGLLEQDTLPDAHFLREQREALVDVHSQGALFPVPAASLGENRDEPNKREKKGEDVTDAAVQTKHCLSAGISSI